MKKHVSKKTKELRLIVALLTFSLVGAIMLGTDFGNQLDEGSGADKLSTGLEIVDDGTTIEENKEAPTVSEENKTPATAQENAKKDTFKFSSISSPVDSKTITMGYSLNTTPVYSKTFSQYRSDHNGVDISAKVGDGVRCVYAGVVEKIYEDEKLGTVIVVSHSDNVKTMYANLDKTVSVKASQSVKKGTVLGKVGSTALYEIEDDPHVHFSITQNGEYINPTQYVTK